MKNIENVIRDIVNNLLSNESNLFFDGIYKSRVGLEDYKRVIEEYGGTLTSPPNDSFSKANVIESPDSKTFVIEYYLWIDNIESDLSIVIEININESGEIESIEISDILVL